MSARRCPDVIDRGDAGPRFLRCAGARAVTLGGMVRALLIPVLLILGCAQTTTTTNTTPPASSQPASLRATSGPVARPRTITAPIDSDGDRVQDANDACPHQAGSLRDGCPVVDTDGDGISDKYDKCPTVVEPRDGRADGDGCPIQAP